MIIRPMTIEDYKEVYSLWQITSKRALSHADNKENIESYINRNKGLSQVAIKDSKIIGTLMAGHDGRRGFFYHMAVLPNYRRKGIAKKMVKIALNNLLKEGIEKTNIFVYCDNLEGQAFWSSLDWVKRDELFAYSHINKL